MSLRSFLLEFTQQHRWWATVGSIYVAVYERKNWHLRVHLGNMELLSVIIEPTILYLSCAERRAGRGFGGWRYFPRKVLPNSSDDEHVGFSRRFDRLQYGLQKIRGPIPTTLSGNLYGSSVSSAWHVVAIYFLGRILSIREVEMLIGISFHGRTGWISVFERGYFYNGNLTWRMSQDGEGSPW